MAETLTELVAKITTDAAGLKSGLSDAEKQTEASSKKMSESLKKVGTVMAASGAAITAALGLMVKAAIDEDINIKRLATTINNSGTAYDSVKDSMEALISTTQRKTGIADNEQRDILNRLILVTNDYGKAMGLLPTVLDLAAAGEMDATTAATYLGKAYLDLQDGAEEVSVRFGQASLQFKSMEDIQNRVAGSAENLANPLSVLKASMGDVAETIGANLIPLIKGLTDKIVDIAERVQGWIKENPELAKQITLVAGALGIFLTIAGGILILAPKIKAAWISMQLVFTASPWGAIIAGIGLLIAAGILLWQNWDKVSHFLADTWDNIKIIFATAIKWIVSTVLLPFITMVGLEIGGLMKGIGKIIGVFNKDLGATVEGVADKFLHAKDTIVEWTDSLVDSSRASKSLRDLERDVEKLTETITADFRKQADEIQASYDTQREESKKAYDAAVEAINKEYGIGEAAKEVGETRVETAKRVTKELKDSYEREKGYAKDRYDDEIERLNNVYDLQIKNLDRETDATIKALEAQIDAIDEQTEAEELAITRAEEANKLAELKGAYESAGTAEDKAKAKEEWDEYATEVARKELLRKRDAEKDALRDSIETTREEAKNEKDRLKETLDANIQTQKDILTGWNTHYNDLAIVADTDLEKNLVRIETDRLAAITAQQEILDETLADIKTAEETDIQALADQLKRANQQVLDINTAYNALTRHYDIEIVTHHIDEYGNTTTPPSPESFNQNSPFYTGEFAAGGVVPGPVGMPQLATVHGGETIIPANESMGNVVVNFTQPVFFDREDTMNRFVQMIRSGIQRQDRLRFGGAYSG